MNNEKPGLPSPQLASPSQAVSLRDRALGIIAFATVLGLLYVGREVLIPITVALVIGLLVAPVVRRLRRTGLAQTPSVLITVCSLAMVVLASGGILGSQVLRMGASLPQYEQTIRQKLTYLDEITVGKLNTLTSEAGHLVEGRSGASPAATAPAQSASSAAALIPVEVHQPRATSLQVLARVVTTVWPPLVSTGIVLVVLVFVLLEHEALRDRFIRVIGGPNIRLTTIALNDAGERLSRFFVSQFVVNLGVGAAIGLGLTLLGVPQALLWGALATLLRFVPYVGIWLAAMLATTLAFAVVPGWSLALATIGLFLGVELVVAQAIEPNLYGHTTGLSPLSVVIAAIFWSTLWGPVGLVLSTPLTLCLLVIGRHIRALGFLDLLLGNAQALTLAQNFYQRALSGDADEILRVARGFLKRNSLAAYCDLVIMPALHLALLDRAAGTISEEQQRSLRDLLVAVVSALTNEPKRLRQRPPSVLDGQSAGLILRSHRQQLFGQWQGPLAVQPGSILLCVGLGSIADALGAELLVRSMRDQGLDARHVTFQDLDANAGPPDTNPEVVGAVFMVSAFPSDERDECATVAARIRERFADARLLSVLLPGVLSPGDLSPARGPGDQTFNSFVAATQACLSSRTPPEG